MALPPGLMWPGKGPYLPQRLEGPEAVGDEATHIWTLSGTLVDINSNPIIGSNIYVFRIDTLLLVGQTVTTTGGVWSIQVPTNGIQYIVLSYNPDPILVGASAALSPS